MRNINGDFACFSALQNRLKLQPHKNNEVMKPVNYLFEKVSITVSEAFSVPNTQL